MKRLFNARFAGVVLVMGGMVATVGLTHHYVGRQVEQAVRQNFTAAGLLSKMQVQAERMRRFEKEMFIYAAVPDRQAKYAKEFDDTHKNLLQLQNEAASRGHKGFSDEDRALMAKWIEASTFYGHEFTRVASIAKSAHQAPISGEQRSELTLKLNSEIGPGKDRFRELLDGAAKLREAKETASLALGAEVSGLLQQVWMALAGTAAAVVLLAAALSMRSGAAGRGAQPEPRQGTLRATHAA